MTNATPIQCQFEHNFTDYDGSHGHGQCLAIATFEVHSDENSPRESELDNEPHDYVSFVCDDHIADLLHFEAPNVKSIVSIRDLAANAS